jgi:arabinogalactan endo-1,4-beta-galactosidase
VPLTRGFFDQMKEYGVEYDVIGLSFYPWSHGTLLDLRDTLHATALHFHKPIILVETGYHFEPSRHFEAVKPPFPAPPRGSTPMARDR